MTPRPSSPQIGVHRTCSITQKRHEVSTTVQSGSIKTIILGLVSLKWGCAPPRTPGKPVQQGLWDEEGGPGFRERGLAFSSLARAPAGDCPKVKH